MKHEHLPTIAETREVKPVLESLQRDIESALSLMDILYGYAYWMTRDRNEASDILLKSCSEISNGHHHDHRNQNIAVRLFQSVRLLTAGRNGSNGHNGNHGESLPGYLARELNATGMKKPSVNFSEMLTDVIRSLPEHLGMLIVLADVLDLTYERIAELVSSTAEEVASHLQSARIELRTALLQYAGMHGLSDGALAPSEQFMNLCSCATDG